jgi:hypothetical protein
LRINKKIVHFSWASQIAAAGFVKVFRKNTSRAQRGLEIFPRNRRLDLDKAGQAAAITLPKEKGTQKKSKDTENKFFKLNR